MTEETPQFKNISIRDITLKGALQAVFMQGLPEMNIENIILSGMFLESDNGFTIIDATGVTIENVELITKNETAFELLNSKNVNVKNVSFNSDSGERITVNGEKSQNISLEFANTQDMRKFISVGQEVPAGAVKFQNN